MASHFYKGPIDPPGYPAYGYGDHLYTTTEEERDDAEARWGYEYERIAGWVYPANASGTGRNNLYRFTSDKIPCGDHFYTVDYNLDKRDAEKAGYWEDWFSPQCKVMPAVLPPVDTGLRIMYRLYNPWNGDHLYSWVGDEIKDAIDNHGYIHDNVSPVSGTVTEKQAFGVYRDQSNKPGLVPLYRLVRTKKW
jgi:hypothetical protein